MAGRREKKKKGGLKIVILLLIVIFVLIYIIASKVYTDYKKYDVALDPANTEMISVSIPAGSTTTSIAQILYDNGIIPDVKKFKMKSRLNGLDGTFQAGDYQFSPSMTTSEIMDLLQNGRKAEVSFTIPEGYTIKDTAEKLAEEGLIASPEDFYAACEEDWESVPERGHERGGSQRHGLGEGEPSGRIPVSGDLPGACGGCGARHRGAHAEPV